MSMSLHTSVLLLNSLRLYLVRLFVVHRSCSTTLIGSSPKSVTSRLRAIRSLMLEHTYIIGRVPELQIGFIGVMTMTQKTVLQKSLMIGAHLGRNSRTDRSNDIML